MCVQMKAAVLYSGGKDSSLMAVILDKLGYDVELVTINFGKFDSSIPARKSAESLGFKHKVIKLIICFKKNIKFMFSSTISSGICFHYYIPFKPS